MVAPETETVALKSITSRLYATMDGLLPKLKSLDAYIQLAKPNLSIPPADFGISKLRKALNHHDAEGAIDGLNILNSLIETWGAPLVPVGFTEEKADELTGAASSINEDNQVQYEIVSHRKQTVQENIGLLNDLNAQISNICKVGKALYRNTDTVKYEEYVFSKLLRKVRQAT